MAEATTGDPVLRRTIAALLCPALAWLGHHWFFEAYRAGREWDPEKSFFSSPFLALMIFFARSCVALLVALVRDEEDYDSLFNPGVSVLKTAGVRGLLITMVHVALMPLLGICIWVMVSELIRLGRPPFLCVSSGGVNWLLFVIIIFCAIGGFLIAVAFLLLRVLHVLTGGSINLEDAELLYGLRSQ
jgi:hypothetical protein